MLNKIIAGFLIVVTIVGICIIWLLPSNDYHYIGVERLDISTARQMQIDKSTSESNNIQITAIDEDKDKIYVSYNFRGNENDAVKYGIPPGDYDKQYYILLILTLGVIVLCGLIVFLLLVYD